MIGVGGMKVGKSTGYLYSLVFIGKMCNSMNFGAMFNYATELYPTSIRTTGLGFTASMSRIGGMLAPQLNLLTAYDQRLPYAIIGKAL